MTAIIVTFISYSPILVQPRTGLGALQDSLDGPYRAYRALVNGRPWPRAPLIHP